MISEQNYIDTLEIATMASDIQGSVVECGVWRGGMAAGLCFVLGNARGYFLFDSFEGLPPVKEIDGKAAMQWQQNVTGSTYYDNCSAPPQFAAEVMAKAGAQNTHLIKGWFDDTIPSFSGTEPVAVLHLDGDWYDSTMVCLVHLFDRVTPGGIIILDDYYAWDGCSRALHEFLSGRSAIERIRSVGNICYIRKGN
jgi:hypothetical protein